MFEVYDNSMSRDTFAGWAYNGTVIIDKDGNVNYEELAKPADSEMNSITLISIFE